MKRRFKRELIFYSMWCDLNWIVLIMGWCNPCEQKYSILTCDNRKVMIWKSSVVELSFEIIIQKDDH